MFFRLLKLELGVAVMPLDRHSPREICARIDRLGLDRERLWLGLGAGFSKRPLTTMREALPELRSALPGVRLVLAAMGPKMSKLAGSGYDGAFLNWITPDSVLAAGDQVRDGAAEADRAAPPVFGYVRVAVGADAGGRLAKEEAFYRDLHDGYRRHFTRLNQPEGTVGVAAASAELAGTELATYDRLDVTVVRGLASATLAGMESVAGAVAPSRGAEPLG